MLISIRDCKYSKKDRHWIEYVYSEYVDFCQLVRQ